ncbi:hypothetical protein Ancab_038458 [Ancistrocladus abbreviatus]
MFREKKVVENIKGDRDIEKVLTELPHFTSSPNHHFQMVENGLGAGSCSYTGGFSLSDDGSSSVAPFDEFKNQKVSTHHIDQLLMDSGGPDYRHVRKNNICMLDELGFARELQNLHIGDRDEVCPNMKQSDIASDGFRILDRNVARIKPINGENYRSFEATSELSSNGGFSQSPLYGANMGLGERVKFGLGQRGCKLGDSMESYFTNNQSSALFSGPGYYNCAMNYPFEERNIRRGYDCYGNGIPIQNSCFLGPYFDDNSSKHFRTELKGNKEALNLQVCSKNMPFCKPYSDEILLRQCGMDSSGNVGLLMNSSQMYYPNQGLGVENVAYTSLKERMRTVGDSGVPQSVVMTNPRKLEAYGSEDTFIIPEKSLNGAIGKYDILKGLTKNCRIGSIMQNLREKRMELNGLVQPERICENGRSSLSYHQTVLQPSYDSLLEARGSIYLIAKDQHGCRFLQKKFDEGSSEDVQIIFNEIIDHVVELMMNPFGNYLIQKLLDVCDEDQRMGIVHMVTREPRELVRISLNTHGTRVVQKLIETLKTRKQIHLVILALEPGFLDLIKDLNGNHVVQRCLQCFSSEDNKFIFDAAAKLCVDIATHRHGCCVLQRCITHSKGEHQQKLIAEISANGLLLAQDPFGNYVVQYIIELNNASATSNLISQFEGHYVHLSMQKFSSHVVEKCLKCFEEGRSRIVHELLSVPHFERLLQDPFANYVIQCALEVTKGRLHDSLVAAVRPHTILRTNPYCKKIFSQGLFKK